MHYCFGFIREVGLLMKKLTRKIVALTLSLVMCISFSNTTFAYADNEKMSETIRALLLKASTTLKQLTRIITVPLIPIFKITNNLILT